MLQNNESMNFVVFRLYTCPTWWWSFQCRAGETCPRVLWAQAGTRRRRGGGCRTRWRHRSVTSRCTWTKWRQSPLPVTSWRDSHRPNCHLRHLQPNRKNNCIRSGNNDKPAACRWMRRSMHVLRYTVMIWWCFMDCFNVYLDTNLQTTMPTMVKIKQTYL